MFFTSHLLAGALIGAAVRRPGPAFAVGLVSHLVMDALPHWGPAPSTDALPIARRDGLLGVATTVTVAAAAPRRSRAAVLAGLAGAGVLDLDKPSKHFFGVSPFPRPVDAVHSWVQHEAPHRMRSELAAGGALAVVALTVLAVNKEQP